MLAFQAAALHRALQKRREELQKSLLVSYAASPRSAVQLRRRYAVMKEAARARRRRIGDARCLPPGSRPS